MEEHVPCKDEVPGSIPGAGSQLVRVPMARSGPYMARMAVRSRPDQSGTYGSLSYGPTHARPVTGRAKPVGTDR